MNWMAVTGNFITSIIGRCRSIHDFAFTIPANNGPPPIIIDLVFDSGSHPAYFSCVCEKTWLSAVMAVGLINNFVVLQDLK